MSKFKLTINIEPRGYTEPNEGVHEFEEGEEVQVLAPSINIDGTEWRFKEWKGDYPKGDSESWEIYVVMDSDKELTAIYEEVEEQLMGDDLQIDWTNNSPWNYYTQGDDAEFDVEVYNPRDSGFIAAIDPWVDGDRDLDWSHSQIWGPGYTEHTMVYDDFHEGHGSFDLLFRIDFHDQTSEEWVTAKSVMDLAPTFITVQTSVTEGDTAENNIEFRNPNTIEHEQQFSLRFFSNGEYHAVFEDVEVEPACGRDTGDPWDDQGEDDEDFDWDTQVSDSQNSPYEQQVFREGSHLWTPDVTDLAVNPADPSDFSLSNDGYDSTVDPGDAANYDYTVENTGDLSGDVEVRLIIEGSQQDSNSHSLGSGSSTSDTLSWDTSGYSSGTYSGEVVAFNQTENQEDDSYSVSTEIQKFELTINISGEGSTNPSEGTHEYDPGDSVNLNAYPSTGWEFDEWTGDTHAIDDPSSADTYISSMDDDYTITAVFEEKQYTVTVSTDPDHGGETDPSEGTHTVTHGDDFTVEAIAYTGWIFTEWTGDIFSSDEILTIEDIQQDYDVTANFQEKIIVDTLSATDVEHNTATINGELVDMSVYDSADVFFRWREDGETTWNETTTETLTEPDTFDYNLSDLIAGSTYEFKAVGLADGTEVTGDVHQFTTGDPDVSVETKEATEVSYDKAVLNGEVEEIIGIDQVQAYFKYRPVGVD